MTAAGEPLLNGLAVALGVAAVLAFGGLPGRGGRRARPAAGWRWVSLLFVAGAAFPPSCRWGTRGTAPLTVVFDASRSMLEEDGPDGRTRWATAWSAWERVAPRLKAERQVLRLTDRLDPGAAPSDQPSGGTAWSGLVGAPGTGPILFFTDGRAPEEDRAAVRAALTRPILAVGLGAASSGPDLSVDEFRAPALGFTGTPVEVAARVSGVVLGGPAATLTLRGPEGVLGRTTVTPSTGPVEVRWSVVPRRPGAWTLRVTADPFPGERRRSNNERSAWIDVRRDRVRALYIAGRPGPHYGFLRAQLKNDPSVELVSFVILRDPEDALMYRDTELSLIPFPTADELAAALPTYDAVILEDAGGARWGLGDRLFLVLDAWGDRGGGVADMGVGVVNLLPSSVRVRFARQQVEAIDFTTSNLRAAPFEIYMGGARVEGTYPLGPLAGTAFNLTMMSYAGTLNMGLHPDVGAVDDPTLLRTCLEEAFAELIAAGA